MNSMTDARKSQEVVRDMSLFLRSTRGSKKEISPLANDDWYHYYMASRIMPEYDPSVTTLTDSQELWLTVLGVISGTLSLIGSTLIIVRICRCRLYTTPYQRIMLGLSLTDLVASFATGWGPLLFLPKETSPRAVAFGNETTCNMLGFLTQFAICAVWYNGLLSFYYLLTVRFGVKRESFAQRYEFWMHSTAVGYFVITGIIGLVFEMYSEVEITQGCWIGEYPENCEANGDCKSTWIGWIFGGFHFMLVFLGLPINNLVIYWHVRKRMGTKAANTSLTNKLAHGRGRQQRTMRISSKSKDTIISSVSQQSAMSSIVGLSPEEEDMRRVRTREVAQQGFFYVFFFYVAYGPAFVIRFLEGIGMNAEKEDDIYWLLVLSAALLPLQGWFNLFIYMRPSYTRVRSIFPERSIWWTIKVCWWEKKLPTLQQAQDIRRQMTLTTASRGLTNDGQGQDVPDMPSHNESVVDESVINRVLGKGSSWAADSLVDIILHEDDSKPAMDETNDPTDKEATSAKYPTSSTKKKPYQSPKNEINVNHHDSFQVYPPGVGEEDLS